MARFEVLTFLRHRARDRHVFDGELVGKPADAAVAAELDLVLEQLNPGTN